MQEREIVERIAAGRTDAIRDYLGQTGWRERVGSGYPSVIQWLVYYDDVTALKWIEAEGVDLAQATDLDRDLLDASFFGHWRTCDLLLARGANANAAGTETKETALHNALCKAGRPYFGQVVRLLLDNGADPNVHTVAGEETGAFMRDVRTCGETPLHRAAAYADLATIELLLERGARVDARDDHGDSPLTWASRHLRPGAILAALCFGEHRIGPRGAELITSDHGAGWGNGMEFKFVGEYLPESV